MSAPRPHQFIALKRLAAGSRQCRQLHMTGPATSPSTFLKAERPAGNLPRDIAGLRAECKRRRLDFSGSKQELTSRLSADELAHSRAFTTAIAASKRPSTTDDSTTAAKPVRHFNTSRVLKAVGDSSTLDFAYLPALDPDEAQNSTIRVPLIGASSRTTVGKHVEPQEADVMRPEISHMSGGGASSVSAMSDVHDNTAMPIDFHAVADAVSSSGTAAKDNVTAAVKEETGALKQLWEGLVEDIVGPRRKAVA